MMIIRVVAFMVTVQLVEKRVNRILGTLMVVIRSAQYRMVDIVFKVM